MKLLLVLLALILPLVAQDFDPFSLPSAKDAPKKTESAVTLFSDTTTIAAGQPFQLALKLVHPEGWHSYYVNPGIIGEVLAADWTLPEGFSIRYQGWPTPHLSSAFGYQSIGYEGTVTHLYTVTPPLGLAPGAQTTIELSASWQICDEKGCIAENFAGSISLDNGEASAPNPATQDDFAQALAHYPQAPDGLTLTAVEADDVITLSISPAGSLKADGLQLYDEDAQIDVQNPHTAKQSDNTILLTVPRNLGNDLAEAGPVKEQLKGILSDGSTSYLVEIPLTTPVDPPVKVTLSGLLPILGGMFIGGLILNLMPCVFPVIGIKIMGFVDQAGHDRKKVILHGVAFAVGVLACFWILATIMLLGGIKNWGGQLENPLVIFTLIIVMLLLAMNMYGVFEIGVGATGVGSNLTRKEGLAGSFFSGVLATVVATPCSAPFLGAALGAAVALPPFWFFTSFTVMALGLALPYLTLSIFPNLVKKLPRPGAWMESFKQGMSFLLFATVGYLLWVYSAQVFHLDYGQKGLWVMIGLSLIAAAGWVWGRWTTPIKTVKTKWIARGITLLLLISGVILAKPGKELDEEKTVQIEWEKWTKETEKKYLAEGRPVYIDFTAKWCLTCQVNKKNAYTQEVVDLMNERNVVFLKGDKTTTNPEIDAELSKLGRSAIPVNVLYVPEDPKPHITPELLNPSFMTEFVTGLIEAPAGE